MHRRRIEELVEQHDWARLEELIASDKRLIRRLVALTYRPERTLRQGAGRAIAIAARHHPKHVQEIVRRFVWAMNDESGTNAVTVPPVILSIAREEPAILLPMVPDLIRLSGDPLLHDGLSEALRAVGRRFPGEIARRLARDLNQCGTGSEL